MFKNKKGEPIELTNFDNKVKALRAMKVEDAREESVRLVDVTGELSAAILNGCGTSFNKGKAKSETVDCYNNIETFRMELDVLDKKDISDEKYFEELGEIGCNQIKFLKRFIIKLKKQQALYFGFHTSLLVSRENIKIFELFKTVLEEKVKIYKDKSIEGDSFEDFEEGGGF